MTETGNQGSSYATHGKYKYREKSTDTNTKTKAQIQRQETVIYNLTFSKSTVPKTSMINDRNAILDLKIQETLRRLGLNRFQCRSVNQLHN